jgi:hypothetical protein
MARDLHEMSARSVGETFFYNQGRFADMRFRIAIQGALSRGALMLTAAMGLAFAPPVHATPLLGLAGNSLFAFDSASPGTITGSLAITGNGSDTLRGIDFRPATGELYAFGQSGQLYTINTQSGVASQVGTPVTPLPGGLFEASFSFNPTVDRIRIITADDVNRSVNPTNGATTVQTPVAYAAGDPNAGQNPSVTAVAYTNQVPGTVTSTTLYAIDGRTGSLLRIDNPMNGALTTIGSLGVTLFNSTVTDGIGLSFDIDGATNDAFALLLPLIGPAQLYSIDLMTGDATALGAFGTTGVRDITVGSLPVPEPGTLALFGLGLVGMLAALRRAA